MAEAKTCFIAISEYHWGRGVSPDEARKKMRRAGGKGKWFLILVTGDDTAEIDGMGNIIYEPGSDWEVVGGTKGWQKHERAACPACDGAHTDDVPCESNAN